MKNVIFRQYNGDRTGNGDFKKVHDFLVKTKRTDYTYGRFDWMMTNWEYLEDKSLSRIGLWEEEGVIVAATLFDHSMDVIFPIALGGYEALYGEMIEYAKGNMVRKVNPEFMICVADADDLLIMELEKHGFTATEYKESVAVFDFENAISESRMPQGYSMVSLAQEEDFEKYMLCMFKGFGHEEDGEKFVFDEARKDELRQAYHRDFINLDLKISIKETDKDKNADGNYVATCGMWYDKDSELALIEPVCVVPECRMLGLGKEVVIEGMRRVKALGAKKVVVGSDQKFYYSLGMKPYQTATFWIPNK